MALASPALSQPRTAGELASGIQSRPNPWFGQRHELPDKFIARRECKYLKRQKERLDAELDGRGEQYFIMISLQETPEVVKRAFVDVSKLCARLKKGEGPLDAWWHDFRSIKSRIELLVDWCANCDSYRIEPAEALPSNYPMYAVFLWPNRDPRVNREEKEDVLALWRAFKTFGESIGGRAAAIWFTRSGNLVDVDRSKYYCDLLDLDYNRGPYLLVSQHRPDSLTEIVDGVLIRLTDLTPARAVAVLNILEQDIRRDSEIRETKLIFEEIKQRMLSIGERHSSILKEIILSVIKN